MIDISCLLYPIVTHIPDTRTWYTYLIHVLYFEKHTKSKSYKKLHRCLAPEIFLRDVSITQVGGYKDSVLKVKFNVSLRRLPAIVWSTSTLFRYPGNKPHSLQYGIIKKHLAFFKHSSWSPPPSPLISKVKKCERCIQKNLL